MNPNLAVYLMQGLGLDTPILEAITHSTFTRFSMPPEKLIRELIGFCLKHDWILQDTEVVGTLTKVFMFKTSSPSEIRIISMHANQSDKPAGSQFYAVTKEIPFSGNIPQIRNIFVGPGPNLIRWYQWAEAGWYREQERMSFIEWITALEEWVTRN